MRVLFLKTFIAALAVATLSHSATSEASEGTANPWSMDTSIELQKFVGFQKLAFEDEGVAGSPIVPAPDGKHFFFVTKRGNLSCDCNESELYVFAVGDVKRALAASQKSAANAPQPSGRLVRRSMWSEAPGSAPILDAHWEGSQSIIFVGAEDHAPQQVYRFNFARNTVDKLTDAPDGPGPGFDVTMGVQEYAVGRDSVVYTAIATAVPKHLLDHYPTTEVDEIALSTLVAPSELIRELYVNYHGHGAIPIAKLSTQSYTTEISPDGRWAIVVTTPADARHPKEWASYHKTLRMENEFRFMLVDIMHGRLESMLNAPMGILLRGGRHLWPHVFWSPDSSQVVLVNTGLPLQDERSAPAAAQASREFSYIVNYDLVTREWQALEPLRDTIMQRGGSIERQVENTDWLIKGKEFLVERRTMPDAPYGARLEGTIYRWTGTRWQSRSTSAQTKVEPVHEEKPWEGIRLLLRQSANDPPAIVAVRGRRELTIGPPDHALIGVTYARQAPVQWREADGHMETGGLFLPQDASYTTPFPLVIQADDYQPDLFRPDGPTPTAFAAQLLVKNGFAVLNVNLPDDGSESSLAGTPKERPAFVERVDAAVAKLAADGLVDPKRLGLIGFSRGGFNVYYAITHPGRTAFSAAIVADSYTGDYIGWLWDQVSSGDTAETERLYGGNLWTSRERWLKDSPSFNVDRVTTPALFTYIGRWNLLPTLDIIGSFRANKRPFDYLLFPYGQHQLARPTERAASLQASVDWMTFWIKGELPSNAETAVRWLALRDQQQAVLNEQKATGKEVAPLPPVRESKQANQNSPRAVH